MYTLLTLLTGVTLAVMISLNGGLSAQYGAFPAAAIIHAVGSVVAIIMCSLQKDKQKIVGHKPKWIYLGGAIGVATTVFQNIAFGNISMTSIVALSLLGQTVTSLLTDSLGLFGMKRRPFSKSSLPGLILSFAGIAVMFDSSISAAALLAIAVSFASGISIVLSRTVNSRLADKVGALRSSMVAHLVGLPITVIIALIASGGTPGTPGTPAAPVSAPFQPWIYLGGALGVMVILLCNLTVPKVSSFRLTMLTFVGQVFTGIALDLLAGNQYSGATFTGGVIIAAGVALNCLLEHFVKKKAD